MKMYVSKMLYDPDMQCSKYKINLFFGLTNDICSSDYTVSNESMPEDNKLERMWKDEGATSLKYCPIQAHARRD